MDYARQQRDPTKHVIGIAFVVFVHALVIYALLTGLARTMVEVIKKPLDATIVEQIKAPPPPPPPPRKIEPPKVQQQPVETYIPPPDIPVPAPEPAPTIQAVTPVAPTTPHVIAPPVVEPPPPPPKPAIRKGITPIKKEEIVYPPAAIRAGIEKGQVVARLAIDEKGNVTSVTIVSADPPKYFDKAVIEALMGWKFSADGSKYIGEVEVNFTLQ